MGFSAFLFKFENGNEGSVSWEKLTEFASKFGKLEETTSGYEIVFEQGIVADAVLVHGGPEQGVSGLTLTKPIDDEYLRPFVFRALVELDMLFFDQDCESGYAATDIREHIPEDLLSGEVIIAEKSSDIW